MVDPLANTALGQDFWYVLDEMRSQRHLARFQNDLQTYAIVLDGVNFFPSEKISCPKCLRRTDRTGTEHFYHSAVTSVFVRPGQAQVLPLPPEFVIPQDGPEKQDCERSEAKRWLEQYPGRFQRIP